MQTVRRSQRSGWCSGLVVRVVVATVLAVLLAALTVHVAREDDHAERAVEERFRERVGLSARHLSAHLGVLADQQRVLAESQLGGRTVSPQALERAVASLGLRSAVVLDGAGGVLAASPGDGDGRAVPTGVDAAGPRWQGALSGVIGSDGAPAVAIAVPYASPSGPRVLRATYEIDRTSLLSFLRPASSLAGRSVHLVDSGGELVAGTTPGLAGPFARHEPELAAAAPVADRVVRRGVLHVVATEAVPGTGWRLVVAAPRSELLRPLGDATRAPWAFVGAFLVVSVAVMALLDRLFAQRDHLRRASRTDGLTGLVNRAHADALIHAIGRQSTRAGDRWAVLMIDVDHFKALNDLHGHAAGDRALRRLATVLRANVRSDDLVARWGGEEFVVVMRGTGLPEARGVGVRLAAAVRALPTGADPALTVSIGVAATTGADADAEALVRAADQALYRAKASGRDRVEVDDGGDLGARDGGLVGAAS